MNIWIEKGKKRGDVMFIHRAWEKLRYRRFAGRNIKIGEYAEIDNSTILGDYCGLAHHASVTNSNIGRYTSIGRYSKVRNSVIGDFCSISWDTTIGANSHPMHHMSTHAFSYDSQFNMVEKTVNFKGGGR